MAENKNTHSQPKKKNGGNQTAPKVVETNASQNVSNEFASYESRVNNSVYYFGLNIFDLYTADQLAALVRDPMANNKILREISLILYGTSGIYTNTVDYMTAMPTLYNVIIPHGKNKVKRKQNKELMASTLRTIKDKEVVRDALWRGMTEGVAFYYFETTGNQPDMQKMLTDYDINNIIEINELGVNASIISLPSDYTEIIGRKNSSYVIAFNLDYFTEARGESTEKKLRKFPKEIRDAYQARRGKKGFTGGNWVVLDNNKTIVHKIRSSLSEKYGRPLVLAAIRDILYEDYFTSTKRNVLNEINNKVIYQTFPEGQNKGSCALTKAQQENQHKTVKNAVMNKNNRGGTSFFSVAAGTKLDSLTVGSTDIFDEKYEANLGDKIATGMGIASSLLDGSSSGSYSSQENNLSLLTAQLFQWIDQIAAELNKCIAHCIVDDRKNWVEVKYLPITYVNQKAMVENAKALYLEGCGSLTLWAAACGIAPDAFYAMLDDEIDEGIYEKYKPHQTSYTLSGKDNNTSKSGRPMTDNPTDSAMQTRNNNGNSMPSPSDKH